MSRTYLLYSVARADFLERVRRYSYLLTLGFAVFLAIAVLTKKIVLRLNEYRGVPEATWAGASMALVCTVFISLVGFYIVKSAVQRDRTTRVGILLATTPLSKPAYMMGKTISNFAVLASMVVALAATAALMPFFIRQGAADYWRSIPTFLLVSLPSVALVSALAVLFESASWLRGGFGNVLYFFLWCSLLWLGVATIWVDFSAIGLYFHNMDAAVQSAAPGYVHGLQLNILDREAARTFPWNGIGWTPALILSRLAWLPLSAVIAWTAAAFFDRFDPANARNVKTAKQVSEKIGKSGEAIPAASLWTGSVHLTPLPTAAGHGSFVNLVIAELLLLVKGASWIWMLGAAGLLIASLLAPLHITRLLLVAIWIWPLLLWSKMGMRERYFATAPFILSSPNAPYRQLAAAWISGVALAGMVGAGVLVRFLIAGDLRSVLSWIAAAFFIPALALSLGVWSGQSKAFEAIYTVWWYAGPLNRLAGLDFVTVSAGLQKPLIYLALSTLLVAAAGYGRNPRFHTR